jgi:hypothetical protein
VTNSDIILKGSKEFIGVGAAQTTSELRCMPDSINSIEPSGIVNGAV